MVDSVSSATAAEVATAARQQARPTQEAQSRPTEQREAAPPPKNEETKVTLKQAEPQPNTADRNAKPTEMYQNVSVLR